MKIDIEELRKIISRLLSSIEEQGYPYVQFDDNTCRWDILGPAIFDTDGLTADDVAPKLRTPSLKRDWEAVHGKDPKQLPVYALVSIAPLLRALGEQFPIMHQVDVAWDKDVKELYKFLGMASLGTESVSEAVGSMEMLMSAAENTDAKFATRSLGNDMLKKGQDLFDLLWAGLKDVVCTIYKDKGSIGDKDLAAYLVAVLVTSATISNPLLVLVITIAVKKGLNKLCAT